MMKNKRYTRVTAFLLTLVLVFSLVPTNAFAVTENGPVLTILHVNDRHGRTTADPYISTLAKGISGNVLILDAGDALHGQITANLSEGESMVELMNTVGYDAMTLGNHEFTFGIERLLELAEFADFPLLAANVIDSEGNHIFEPCAVYEMDGLKVGVFGLATPETISSVDPRTIEGVTFSDPVQTAEMEVMELKDKGCDVIIALTHLGLDNLSDPKDRSDTLAKVEGIDIIVDGHSHTELDSGLFVGDTLIAQTGDYGQNIGVVEITALDGKLSKAAKLIPVPSEGETVAITADETIVSKISELDKEYEDATSVKVGYTPVLLRGEKTELRIGGTNLADLITDSMRQKTGADIAFMSGGNIRASIDTGDITMGEVLTTMPYSNILTAVELLGTDVLKILEHGVSLYPEPVSQYIHVSGVNFTFDPNLEVGNRVTTVRMPDGSAFLPYKTYKVATIDYIASGGDGYEIMTKGKNLTYHGGDAEALVAYLATEPAISPEAEGRALDETHSCAKDIEGHWGFLAIETCHKYGLMDSDAQGYFRPDAPVTDEEACGLLASLLPNIDVAHSHRNEPITREQLALAIEAALDGYLPHANDCDEDHYTDTDKIEPEALTAVMCMYDVEIMRGVDGERFDPKGIVTRAQMASVLTNIMNACVQAYIN